MERNTFKDNKLFFGEVEFRNLMRVLIKAYQYRNKNVLPEAIVIPDVREVLGVRIEFLATGPEVDTKGPVTAYEAAMADLNPTFEKENTDEGTGQPDSEAGDSNSRGHSEDEGLSGLPEGTTGEDGTDRPDDSEQGN